MIKCRVYLVSGFRYYFYANSIDEAFKCLLKFNFNDGEVDSVTFNFVEGDTKK